MSGSKSTSQNHNISPRPITPDLKIKNQQETDIVKVSNRNKNETSISNKSDDKNNEGDSNNFKIRDEF